MPLTLWVVVAKTTVVHTVTYFVMGLTAMTLFRYARQFEQPHLAGYMRPTSDPLVRAGVLFQPIRGVLFGLIFYVLRDVVFQQSLGWLLLWATLVVIGILSTFGPTPGSIEGLIYTKHAFKGLWGGMIEVLTQSFLLAALTFYWVTHPSMAWLTWTLISLFAIVLILPALGLLANQRTTDHET